MSNGHRNRLLKETSPYLLSHAHQKIDWYPWGTEAFDKARAEDKLLFISIGYSANHWCREMSKKSFDNESICEILNSFYVSVKVDKEERPDVDQFYLNAIQLMSDSGGWPISCFALPNGEPIWGGTYFEADDLIGILLDLEQSYREDPEVIRNASKEVMNSLSKVDRIYKKKELTTFSIKDLKLIVEPWRRKFDKVNGGNQGTPKFPLPHSILFLFVSSYYLEDSSLSQHVLLTLHGLANGGIHDQLGGGFFHYAHDAAWRLPNFEKMVFDNSFILMMFAVAQRSRMISTPVFEKIIIQTVDFMLREMSSPNSMFYTSVHAESDGAEGEYYLWKLDDMHSILGEDSALAVDYFGITPEGKMWGKNSLYVNMSVEALAEKYRLLPQEVEEKLVSIKQWMLVERNKRVRLVVDTKIIAAYNITVMHALFEVYYALGKPEYLERVLKMTDFLIKNFIKDDFRLLRSIDGKTEQTGFLDDYAYMIKFLLKLYPTTGKEIYLEKAIRLTSYVQANFYDEESGMYFFTEQSETTPPLRFMDLIDKANPSSNSIMALSLTVLSVYTGNTTYRKLALQMLSNVKSHMYGSGPYMAHWALVSMLYAFEPIVAFTTTPGKLAELSRKPDAPNLIYSPANKTCLEHSGTTYNGWYYYHVDLSGSEEENALAYQRLFEHVLTNRHKKIKTMFG